MRQFTKTHNDIEWLFPIANSKKGAEAIFDEREEQADICNKKPFTKRLKLLIFTSLIKRN